jgi:hypothetical protein
MSDPPPPRRGRGRPPLDPHDPSVDVHVRVPSRQYDALYRRARDARLTVAEYLRVVIAKVAPKP